MSDVRPKILLFLLLLLFTMTAAAQDVIIQRGCRRGTPRPEGLVSRRGSPNAQPKRAGGDFYHGERHQLTVLVEFNDRAFKSDSTATKAQWEKIFNAENLTENPFKGSVHDYFMDQSYGDFNLVFDLIYIQVSGDAKKYASTSADDENSQYLVEDIMEVLKTRDIDWSLYDWNGDGYVNQLLIVYAGKGMNDGGGSNTIWPHQWWMSEHLKDSQPDVYCDPIPVTYGGKEYKVDCYCALAELTRNNDYGSFGTICHEYSHCFGFPDFYYGSNTSVVGGWDLMDNGNYNGGGYCPSGYSSHERWLMGWLSPTELNESTTVIDMPQLSEQPVAYLVRNDEWKNEYYFIENRQKTGWDAEIPGHGVIVFHIDFEPSVWTSTKIMPNSSSNKRYTIFPANNNTSTSSSNVSKWGYPYQGNDSLTNFSTPKAKLNHENIDGDSLMSKPITNMIVTDGKASFKFMPSSATAIREQKNAYSKATVLYRFGNFSIIRSEKGEIRKVMERSK